MNPEITIENYQTFIEELLYKLFLAKFEHEREFIHHGITFELTEEFYDDLQYEYKLSTINQIINYPVDLSIILDKAHKKYHQD